MGLNMEHQELADYLNDVLLHKAWEESGEEMAGVIVERLGYAPPESGARKVRPGKPFIGVIGNPTEGQNIIPTEECRRILIQSGWTPPLVIKT